MVTEFHKDLFGSVYTVRIGTAKELGLDDKFSGDTDFHTKVIRIRTDVDTYGEPGRADTIRAKTLRHELYHAALYETGLLQYCDDETLVSWLEVMTPKVETLYTDANYKLVERTGCAQEKRA